MRMTWPFVTHVGNEWAPPVSINDQVTTYAPLTRRRRRSTDTPSQTISAAKAFAEDVGGGVFPQEEHSAH
ncbi:hypothetical protein [Streptomyces sp. NPDC058632]|uniref:hypothetical protein n=1 Tax=unclassified Streptomyces TaxID=2593676 RepID=UPI003646E1AC